MPVEYKMRHLRRLFGEGSFLRIIENGKALPRIKRSGLPSSVLSKSENQTQGKSSEDKQKKRTIRSSGGVPRAFFNEQPPRVVKGKAAGGQLNVIHLFEKQKMKLYYGAMRDDQFKKYVDEARSGRSNTDAELMRLLELRLDTFLYRTGFPKSPMQGRQWIFHNKILINGERVNIKSFRMRPGDLMTITNEHMEHAFIASTEAAEARKRFNCGMSWIASRMDPAGMVPWMEIDRKGLSAILVRQPTDEELRSMTRAALFPFIRDANMNPHAAMRSYR